MKNKKKLFSKEVYAKLPLQFLYVEEVAPFKKKTKTTKIHSLKNGVTDQLIVTSFYKPISKLL